MASHLPSLSPSQLDKALKLLAASKLSPKGKRQIAAMLKAAAAGGDSVNGAIAALEPERQAEVQAMIAELDGLTTNAVARGGAALLAIDDDEWERLLAEDA